MLRLRRETPALRTLDLARVETHADDERRVLLVRRDDVMLAFNFSDQAQTVPLEGNWRMLMETGAKIEKNALTLPRDSFALMCVGRL